MIRTNKFNIAAVGNKYVLTPKPEHARAFGGMIMTNETGKIIYELLENEMTEEELVSALAARFECDTSVVEGSLTKFLEDCSAAGAISGYGG